MYDPKQRVRLLNKTVRGLCVYLMNNTNPDAELAICEGDDIFIHVQTDGMHVDVSDSSLSDLCDEYWQEISWKEILE